MCEFCGTTGVCAVCGWDMELPVADEFDWDVSGHGGGTISVSGSAVASPASAVELEVALARDLLGDVEYAMRQAVMASNARSLSSGRDCGQRAADGLERVLERLRVALGS
jgi:hypothetical protein